MFFRETKETEEDIRRMFHEAIDKIKNRITLKKKSDPGNFGRGVTRTRRRQVLVDPARSFAELDWSSSANGRAESVSGPTRPFAELDWSSSANGSAESVSGPAQGTAELNPCFDDRVCLFRRTDH
ncbi:hypothetical protein F2Q69_00042909 [Brassica cretica]|uniref:Uncharacterized protein n=1 Tax=Brassica cretica TaxID=69181 RepID=A0A8S9NA49_BRACR|nr:hypothetical protein F2Q69_00042909 [Brassica cretica]